MAKEPQKNDRPLFSWFGQAGLGSGHEDRRARIILAMGLHQQGTRRRQTMPAMVDKNESGD